MNPKRIDALPERIVFGIDLVFVAAEMTIMMMRMIRDQMKKQKLKNSVTKKKQKLFNEITSITIKSQTETKVNQAKKKLNT